MGMVTEKEMALAASMALAVGAAKQLFTLEVASLRRSSCIGSIPNIPRKPAKRVSKERFYWLPSSEKMEESKF